MNEKHSELFRSLAEDIKNRRTRRKEVSRECAKVLDEEIRPAIRQAGIDIVVQGEWIEFNADDKSPCVRIGADEVRFICSGGRIEIRTTIRNKESSDDFDIRDLSEDLVVDKIVRFLKRVYDLP